MTYSLDGQPNTSDQVHWRKSAQGRKEKKQIRVRYDQKQINEELMRIRLTDSDHREHKQGYNVHEHLAPILHIGAVG